VADIRGLFVDNKPDNARLEEYERLPEPGTRYVIAMTPRSGSSFLADVMASTRVLGMPDEFLESEFIPKILEVVPARNADEYLRNVLKRRQSKNGVSGLKASWFQYRNFCGALNERPVIRQFRYIYLTRRNLEEQAVSLYKATETKVFHTNVAHSEEALQMSRSLEYRFDKIDYWYRHIAAQERGWKEFFISSKITPLTITYEDIRDDVTSVIKRIAAFLKLDIPATWSYQGDSVFRKLGDRKNLEWAYRFGLDKYDQSQQEQAGGTARDGESAAYT
jgi:LPS sulfotransferase NodH